MSGFDSSESFVLATLTLWLADVGTTAPADARDVLGVGWRNVGLSTEDSLKFSEEPQFEQMRSAQSNFPTRTFQTQDACTLELDLQQWNAGNFKAVYGGGTFTAITPAGGQVGDPKHFKFAPPRVGKRKEIAVVLDMDDGEYKYRFIVPRAMQMEGVPLEINKGKEAILPLRLAVQGGDDVDPWYLITDNPALDPATLV
jgi:hypothetical protein